MSSSTSPLSVKQIKCKLCRDVQTTDNVGDMCEIAFSRGLKTDLHVWVEVSTSATARVVEVTPKVWNMAFECRYCNKKTKKASGSACADLDCTSHKLGGGKKSITSTDDVSDPPFKKIKTEGDEAYRRDVEAAAAAAAKTKKKQLAAFSTLIKSIDTKLKTSNEEQGMVVDREQAKYDRIKEAKQELEQVKELFKEMLNADEPSASTTVSAAPSVAGDPVEAD